MIPRLAVALICVCLLQSRLQAKEISAAENAPLIQILVVQGIDEKGERIFFERQANLAKQTTVQNGQAVTEVSFNRVRTAFSLEHSEVMTANGKEIEKAELWRRIKVGKPVVVLSPEAVDGEGSEALRKLFKDDTILLIGGLEDAPVLTGKPARR